MTVKEIWQKLFGPAISGESKAASKKTSLEKSSSKAEQPKEAVTASKLNDGQTCADQVSETGESPESDPHAEADLNDEDAFIDYGVSKDDVHQALCALQADYAGRGCELKEVASGYRFQVNDDLAIWLQRWKAEKPPRYSRAVLETLAIIAYKQPITRAEIEDIRGVAVSSHIVKGLLEREWVRIVGHKEVPGRPALFATTKVFLDYFNVSSLEELPTLAEIKELGVRTTSEADGDAQAKSEGGEDEQVSSPEQVAEQVEPVREEVQTGEASLEATSADEPGDQPNEEPEAKETDNAIKNEVECDDSDALAVNSSENTAKPTEPSVTEADSTLISSPVSGSIFDQHEALADALGHSPETEGG
jgi:segregation and condensation protein B